jgi:ParB/RepB/Spo0J family partition protein
MDIGKEDLSSLMMSIKDKGLLQAVGIVPIPKNEQVNGKKYKTIYGNRRLTACKKLRIKKIPARIVYDAKNPADQVILNLVENDQRKSIDAFEFGRSCLDLIENHGYGIKELAIALATSIQKIKSCVDIFKYLPEEYSGKIMHLQHSRSRTKDGEVSYTHAKTIVEMQRKYALKKPQMKQILELASKNNKITTRSLNYIMYLTRP